MSSAVSWWFLTLALWIVTTLRLSETSTLPAAASFYDIVGMAAFSGANPEELASLTICSASPWIACTGFYSLRLCCSNNTLARLYVLRVTAGLTLFVLYQTSRPFSGVGGWDQRSSTPPHTDRLSPTWKPGKLAPSPYRNTNSSHVAECTNL